MKISTINYLIVAAALTSVSCSFKNPDPLIIATEIPNEIPYELSETQFQSSGMKLGKMEMKAFHEVVKANGMFDVPPENRATVSSYFGGTVKNIQLLPGERVKEGQVLFILENPDFVQLQQDYLEAKGQLTYLESDYERQKNLAQDNIASQKNYLRAESDYTVTRVKLESLSKKLTLMNLNPSDLTMENIRTTVTVTSPINGYVTQVNITRGMFLNPSQAAITIVNTDHLHLELNIFEKDLPKVRVGQPIRFKTQEDKSKEYQASVHLVNKTVDLENRTIGIHGHLSDEKLSDRFNPGMYLEADIYTTSESRASLPQNALVEVDGKYYVLVLTDSSNVGYAFSKKEVKTGSSNNDYVEILNTDDFEDKSEVLVNGAFNLVTE
ncbi:MAG: efflux RND transporter periplasmic adaptor subunit [Saprospiraceae bacterium]|nr:efflux RND transporter periplasmic adaptor subunit [Saprospiraceae bacterium]